ncbi:hypothetical protein QAD02_013228 [Eretmocerus hayati]|uniref:Uncharacterized protein n=1 Tax=Eretmocerus hayati TaxID=131215 RepID=A0ACC2P3P9_9HYME|nr:hypothetical protein QAD02_013228 [Eretmocerus hayati]
MEEDKKKRKRFKTTLCQRRQQSYEKSELPPSSDGSDGDSGDNGASVSRPIVPDPLAQISVLPVEDVSLDSESSDMKVSSESEDELVSQNVIDKASLRCDEYVDHAEETKCGAKDSSASFSEQLIFWASKNEVRHTMLTESLGILLPRFPELPKTAKTFLHNKSSPQYQIEQFMPGDESDESEACLFWIRGTFEGNCESLCICFICDRPARSFIKQTKGHAGLYACERCHLSAIKQGHRTILPDQKGEIRTDASFKKKMYLRHHNLISPLEEIDPWVDMIGGEEKMSAVNGLKLTVRMANLSHQIPWEFQRKTRSISLTPYWAADEYDFYLKYCGPMVLESLIDTHLFEHFLLLHASFRIMSCPKLHKTHLAFAGSYLNSFVELARLPNYYSDMMTTIKMHDLLLMPDDVEEMGCDITKYTAFPFENDLGVTLKRGLRSGNKPWAQITQRRAEQDLLIERPEVPATHCILETAKRRERRVISKLNRRGFEIGSSYPNSIVLLDNAPAFSYPPKCFEVLNMFVVEEDPAAAEEKFSMTAIKSKCTLFKIYELNEKDEEMFVVPMLHT